MPKVILDKRETELWLLGKSKCKDPNNMHCNDIPNGWTHDRWRQEVSDALYLVAGHMGGYGIDLIGYDGKSLSEPDLEMDFTYQPPDQKYNAVPGGKLITINDIKSS